MKQSTDGAEGAVDVAPPQDRPLVLVVEDDPDISRLVSYLLEEEGYRVLTANEGERAIVLAQEHEPDLMILDALLPTLSGEEVANRLRDAPRRLPILVLSASADLAGLADRLDAVGYLRKPFDLDQLARAVKEALAARPVER